MDARTARCLGVSSGMPMNFHPHRPMVPARSRYHMPHPPPQLQTVQQQHQQQRPMYTQRASSYDPYTVSRESINSTRATPQPQYHQSYTPITTSQSHFYSNSMTPTPNMAYTPLITDIDSAYFSKCATPESTLAPDLWDDAFKIHNNNSTGKPSDFDEFGLGLGPLGDNLSGSTVKGSENELFNFPDFTSQADPISAQEASSPDGHSWSTLSDASGGVISDFPDFTAEAELVCFNSDYSLGLDSVIPSIEENAPTTVQNNLQKSTVSSIARSSPSHRYRTSPYPSNPGRSRSFTTGSMLQTQRGSPFAYGANQTPNFASQHTSPLSNNMSASQASDVNTFFDEMSFDANSTFMPSSFQHSHPEVSHSNYSITAELDSNLPSSIAPKSQCEHSFAGSSEPPNLYGALSERPISPPPEDMNPENEDDMPRVQELRFEGDLYTPKYVRGHGNKREGWCGICKPGRWLVLKNSAFWYDKSFTHGISAATGAPFESPRETRRMKSNPDVWEGLCHSCGQWIALISSKKKGTTWFRHAYKCHTHQKVKDTPKRRREASHAKAIKAAQSEDLKCESREETPFPLEIAAMEAGPKHHQRLSSLETVPLML